MTALEQLIRLHSWTLEERRRKASDLERLADRLRLDVARLDAEVVQERHAAAGAPELQRAFAAYVGLMRSRRERLQRSIVDVEGEIEQAQAEVAAAYQELKKYEQAQSNRRARDLAVQRRREQIAGDELGISMFRRRPG